MSKNKYGGFLDTEEIVLSIVGFIVGTALGVGIGFGFVRLFNLIFK